MLKNSEPFGQRAVRLGFVTSEQVRRALETQDMLARKGGLIGEILVEQGWMDPEAHIGAIREISSNAAATAQEAEERFIALSLKRSLVTREDVDKAREIQRRRSKNSLIGQILVEMGVITPQNRDRILATY